MEAVIYILNTSLVKENYSFVLSYISKNRREKAEKLINEKDRLLSIGGGYLLKKYLPSEEIKVSENGKPYLENGPCFNLSHSEKYVVLAIHPSFDVGVDIEKINGNKVDAIKYTLSKEEKNITDIDTLFQIWSNKESLIKCKSTGLKDIKNVNGLPLEGMRLLECEEYYSKSIVYDGYSLSISLKTNNPVKIKIIPLESLEK